MKDTLLTEKLMAKVGMKDRPKVIDLTGRVGTADTLTEAKIHCATGEKVSKCVEIHCNAGGKSQ